MTNTARLEDQILAHLATITNLWDFMLTPRYAHSITPGARTTGTLADDHADTDTDTPHLHATISLRRETTDNLTSWATLVITERDLRTNLPTRGDAHGLCRLLQTHARWLATHPAGTDAEHELHHWATRVRTTAFPQPREWMPIGNCPTSLGAGDTCGMQVRVYPHHPGNITCPGCGTTDTLDGWVLRIVGTEGPYTAPQLVIILHRRMGITIKESTIRQWVARGVIEPVKDGFHPRTQNGANLYDPHDVMTRLARREHTMLRNEAVIV